MTPIHFWLDSNFFPLISQKMNFRIFLVSSDSWPKMDQNMQKVTIFKYFDPLWAADGIPYSKSGKSSFWIWSALSDSSAGLENSKNWFHLDLPTWSFRYFDPFRVTSGFVAKFGKILFFRIWEKKFESNLWGNIYE